MREFAKPLLLVGLALAVPILPLAIAGDWLETKLASYVHEANDTGGLFVLVVAVLAVDIVLPVPSSGVGTWAGAKLGMALGTTAIWLGATAGAVVGFALARMWGAPIAVRLAGRDALDRLKAPADRWGAWLLLVTRPLPILAEATVLLLGTTGLSWRVFMWSVAAGNLVVAVAYAALGDLAGRQGWLATAVVLALVLPLAVGWLVHRRLTRPS